MADRIRPAEIRALGRQLLPPASVSIRISSAQIDSRVQTELKGMTFFEATFANERYTILNTEHHIRNLGADHFKRFLYRVVMMLVDLGTSRLTDIPNDRYLFFERTAAVPKEANKEATPATYGACRARDIWAAIIAHEPYPRRWARRYAETAHFALGIHTEVSSPLAIKWGYTPETRAVGFDFSDAIPLHRVTALESTAINNARVANTMSRDQSQTPQTSTHTYYHMGQINRISNLPQIIAPPVRLALPAP